MNKIKFVLCASVLVCLSYACSKVQEIDPIAKNASNVLAPNASNAPTPSADAGSAARGARTLTAENLANNLNFQKYLQTGIDFNAPSLANLRTKSKEELLAIKSQLVNANVDDAQAVYLSVMGVSAKAYQDHLMSMNDQWKLVVKGFPELATMNAEQTTQITTDAFNLYRIASGGGGGSDCGWGHAGCVQGYNTMAIGGWITPLQQIIGHAMCRSEERRVGKECSS